MNSDEEMQILAEDSTNSNFTLIDSDSSIDDDDKIAVIHSLMKSNFLTEVEMSDSETSKTISKHGDRNNNFLGSK